MTRYLNIWLEDEDGFQYHVEKTSDGCPYIIHKIFSKVCTFNDIKQQPIGYVYDRGIIKAGGYGLLKVIRNDYYQKSKDLNKMNEYKGLPVAGYVAQSDEKIAIVNKNKELEERVLRQIDSMIAYNDDPANNAIRHDARMIALAKTHIETGFMFLNRAVFKPNRIKLPEDIK